MRIFTLLAIGLLFGSACKTVKPVPPEERYDTINRFERRNSVLNIPVRINMRDLERSLNTQLTGILYQDDTFEDGDKLKVTAEKDGDISLRADGMGIIYSVPLKLWMQYNLGLGRVELDGGLSLTFRTGFDINTNWQLVTVTTLDQYNWTQRPRVSLGRVSLPIENIANLVIRRSESTIAESIDGAVSESFKMEEYVADAWRNMFAPYLVSEEYQTWLLVNPRDIGMTPIIQDRDELRASILVQSQPELRFGPEPAANPALPLPLFHFRNDTDSEGFHILVDATMSFDQAEALARQSLVGERFESGRRYVVIEDVDLYGQGNNLVVNVRMTGSYNGSIFLTGEPVFNPQRNRIEVEDLDFTLDTRSFLLKSASWLVRGTLKRKLQENLDFLLDYNLKDAQEQMQAQLGNYEIAPGITLQGTLDQLDLYNAYLTTDGFRIAVSLDGKVAVNVAGLVAW
ncbi:MAG: DUF4403 family protein [Lewinella sp.]|nr:DUF4403 family protein [Lewinella sp.]